MRGLMRDSQIVIFDEPLAGLDQKTREKVIKLIVEETQGKTVLVITHDPEILPHLDHMVYLQEIQDNFLENFLQITFLEKKKTNLLNNFLQKS